MKKILLVSAIVFATLNIYAQKCGAHIDLYGIGIKGETKAMLSINPSDDLGDVAYVIAEAVYKSEQAPVVIDVNKNKKASVRFYTGDANDPVQEEYVLPGDQLKYSGDDPKRIIHVFRAKFDKPAETVSLDILENAADFYSFAIYVYRKDGSFYTVKAGELVHVYHNVGEEYDVEMEIPTSDQPRNITFRFGITELNLDSRDAKFTFWADELKESTTIVTFDEAAGESYIIQDETLENVPGYINKITMTMLSEEDGDSFIAGIVLADFPCEEYESELLCSFTQCFYGNAGGKYCGKMGTTELLEKLLFEDPLIMGEAGTEAAPGKSFTIENAACVLKLLPGGGPSKILMGDANCEDEKSYESNKQGRLKNTLLAQGITLTLNTRLSFGLLNFPVNENEFVTMMAMDCMDPNTGGVPGTEMVHAFSPEIVAELGPDATIANLLDLVNDALAGKPISVSLSQVADAAGLVNEAFDECVVVIGYAEITPVGEKTGETDEQKEVADPDGKKGMTGVSDNEEEELGIYPNPVTDHFYLDMPAGIEDVRQAAIYSTTGVKVMDIEQSIQHGSNQAIEINVSHLNEGVYFVRIEMANGSLTRRFGIQ